MTPTIAMTRRTERYVHGTRPEEQRRLTRLNDLLNDACLRELALKDGEAVLDVGSGLGQFTRAMGRTVGPKGRVVGIERDRRQIAEARRQAKVEGDDDLVDWRQGDALSLPLGKNERFDVAHARFVLEHVPQPKKVVEQMVRAVRPGGRVVLSDDDHDVLRLYPELPAFDAVWRAY